VADFEVQRPLGAEYFESSQPGDRRITNLVAISYCRKCGVLSHNCYKYWHTNQCRLYSEEMCSM
jgi:hypothetical protein